MSAVVDAVVDKGGAVDNLKRQVAARLKAARAKLKLTQKELCTATGMPLPSLKNYEGAKQLPGSQAQVMFSKAGINTGWLMTGEGEMLLADMPYGAHQATVLGCAPEEGKYVALPLYNNIHAAAGHGAVVDLERPDDALMFQKDWIRSELGARPDDLCLIRVSGDSMEPTLRAGDVILVNRQACRPDREGIYILRIGDMLLVKRLQAMPGGQVKVTSDNTAFDSWMINLTAPDADVIIVGRVVWSGRRL